MFAKNSMHGIALIPSFRHNSIVVSSALCFVSRNTLGISLHQLKQKPILVLSTERIKMSDVILK